MESVVLCVLAGDVRHRPLNIYKDVGRSCIRRAIRLDTRPVEPRPLTCEQLRRL
jgi:hypothetical protein